MEQSKHPLQVRLKETREELTEVLAKFKSTIPPMPSEVIVEIEKHLHKLDAITNDLKEIQLNDYPSWLTREVWEEWFRLWHLMDTDGKRYTHRVEAFKFVQRTAEEAGYRIGLTDFDILRKKFL